MRTKARRWRLRALAVCCLSALLVVITIPIGAALAEPERPGNPVGFTLERLSEVLGRLEAELAALEGPAAERLEEGIEQIIELIEALLDDVDRPGDQEEDGAAIRSRILKLDLMLHRLLYVLDEIVESAKKTPARPRAKEAVDDLRSWVDGYVDGATSGMRPREAARFEKAAHEIARSLAGRVAESARKVHEPTPPDRARPILARLVERLEELLFYLDGLILRSAQRPPSQE